MQMPWRQKHQSRMDILIDSIHDEIGAEQDKSSEKVKALTEILNGLYKTRNECDKSGIDPNTVLTVSVYAGLVLVALGFEAFGHSITTKIFQVLPLKPSLK